MIALLKACLFFEILVHVLNIVSAKARAKTVFGHLKQNPKIEGIKVGAREIKITQYADDARFFQKKKP